MPGGDRPNTEGAKLGEIIQTMAIFVVGFAAGYAWRDRISKARRAEEHERRERRRQQAAIREMNERFGSIELPSFLLH
jgi:hypothetical protein